jgi:hypothetical protein
MSGVCHREAGSGLVIIVLAKNAIFTRSILLPAEMAIAPGAIAGRISFAIYPAPS